MARRPPRQELTILRKQAMFGDVSVGGGEIFTGAAKLRLFVVAS